MKSNKDLDEKTEIHQSNPEIVSSNKTIKLKGLTDKQKSLLRSAAAGVGGVALGAVAMTLMGWITKEEAEKKEPTPPNTINRKGDNDYEVPIFEKAPFSDAVDDGMDFNEAFAAARRDLGPGGFFEWHGETYNTYYKEEWEALSPEEQHQFYASIDPNHSTDDIVSEEEILDILNDEDEIVDIGDLDNEDIIIDDSEKFAAIDFSEDEIVVIENDEDTDEDIFSDDDDISFMDDDIDISDLG